MVSHEKCKLIEEEIMQVSFQKKDVSYATNGAPPAYKQQLLCQ